MFKVISILFVLLMPLLLQAKEYRFEKEQCAIVIPDTGWNAMQSPQGAVQKPVLSIRSSDGLKAITFLILPGPSGFKAFDSATIVQIEEGIRDGNQGEYLVELTGTTLMVSGAPGYLTHAKYDGGAVRWGESLFVIANGYSYIINVVSNGTKPDADSDVQSILQSFRLLTRPGATSVHHDTRLVGTWKGSDKGKVGYIRFDSEGYASFVIDGKEVGGRGYEMNGVRAYMVYEVDSSASPPTIDFVLKFKENDVEFGRLRGIYKFTGRDSILVRMRFEGTDRPEGFEPAGNPDTITLKRVKK